MAFKEETAVNNVVNTVEQTEKSPSFPDTKNGNNPVPEENRTDVQEEEPGAEEKELLQEFETNNAKLQRRERKLHRSQYFLLHALLFVFVVWLLFWKVVGVATMPNNDMHPRIDSGDLLLYSRIEKTRKAQDVVVFIKNHTRYVGRIAAVGGDVIEITDAGGVKVNNNFVSEPDIYEATVQYEGYVDYPFTVPEGEYFILADHRQGGEDSRYFGSVKQSEILGTVINLLRRNNL